MIATTIGILSDWGNPNSLNVRQYSGSELEIVTTRNHRTSLLQAAGADTELLPGPKYLWNFICCLPSPSTQRQLWLNSSTPTLSDYLCFCFTF